MWNHIIGMYKLWNHILCMYLQIPQHFFNELKYKIKKIKKNLVNWNIKLNWNEKKKKVSISQMHFDMCKFN